MRRIQKPLAIVTFLVYMLAMVWLVLFKGGTGLYELLRFGLPDLPRGISWDLHFNGMESLLNVGVFVPLGLFLMLLSSRERVWPKALVCCTTSVAFETAQYILKIGTCDVMDVINNTLGGVLGILLFVLLKRLLKARTRPVLTLLAIPGTAAFVLVTYLYR